MLIVPGLDGGTQFLDLFWFERRRGDPPNLLLCLLRGEQQGFGRFAIALWYPKVLDIHPVQADEDGHVQEVGVGVGSQWRWPTHRW